MGGSIFPSLFIGLFVLIGVAILAFALRSLHQAKAAADWPVVQGRIVTSDFKESSDDDGTTYKVEVSYTYSVNGVDQTGKRIAFGYSGSSAQKFHREIHNALKVGADIGVRYRPEEPSVSVLSYGINNAIIFLLIFGAIWTFFSLGMAALVAMDGEGAETLLSRVILYS